MTDPQGQGGPGTAGDLPDPLSGPLPDPFSGPLEELLDHGRRGHDDTPPEVEVTGTLRRLEVEGRPWVLLTDDGRTLELQGPPGARLPVVGTRVRAVGRLDPEPTTSSQVGPALAWSLLEEWSPGCGD